MPDRVRIYEVGPRDGLQNEATPIALDTKLGLIERLVAAGLKEIEATSFVSPKAIPQLADADELVPQLPRDAGVRYAVLVPNELGMTVDESLAAFEPVLRRAADLGWWRRGYVSTAFGCPYTGAVDPHRAVNVATRLLELGVDEVCFGDTIGVGVPAQVTALTDAATGAGIELHQVAYHFHDTRGTALANVVAGLDAGVRCFDSSTGGTGGCPYAPGAAGNLATEDLVYLLDASGYRHGVDLEKVLDAARFVAAALGRPLSSKVGQAGGWDAATGSPIGR
jgi:hydroxymethylglutaryl-CoA lyase